MKRVIFTFLLVFALSIAYADTYKFPQPMIKYDMKDIIEQTKRFREMYKKYGRYKKPQLVYLYSDSVPKSTIENVFKQAKKIKSIEFTGCMRGFIGNTAKDLKRFIQKQVEKGKIDNIEVRLDPFFFRDLNVKQVPALVYAHCTEQPVECDYDYIIYGDSRLDYLVDKIYEASKDKLIGKVLEELRNF
ncbi:TrbC family F-type conjugative pilus assembly protein [Deferribacter abyssi]|uniref:TrbC family F-type conjugative pilus assembly protein n=1 Tax=Deferribacter abyssi TaxID=213806 RepID=UPI003C2A6480